MALIVKVFVNNVEIESYAVHNTLKQNKKGQTRYDFYPEWRARNELYGSIWHTRQPNGGVILAKEILEQVIKVENKS